MNNEELEVYKEGDSFLRSANAPVPKWLMATYIILPIWGIIWFMMFWNGSWGWFDRGYWHELQEVANTTIPQHNANE